MKHSFFFFINSYDIFVFSLIVLPTHTLMDQAKWYLTLSYFNERQVDWFSPFSGVIGPFACALKRDRPSRTHILTNGFSSLPYSHEYFLTIFFLSFSSPRLGHHDRCFGWIFGESPMELSASWRHYESEGERERSAEIQRSKFKVRKMIVSMWKWMKIDGLGFSLQRLCVFVVDACWRPWHQPRDCGHCHHLRLRLEPPGVWPSEENEPTWIIWCCPAFFCWILSFFFIFNWL